MNLNSTLTEIFAPENARAAKPILFLDFDGTISERDVIDAILENFASSRWLEIEDEWTSGKIGSRECLRRQFALVKAAPEELNEFLDALALDCGLPDLLNFIEANAVTTHIVSDGFGYYIKRLLLERHAKDFPHLLKRIFVWANDLAPAAGGNWAVGFPYFERVCADGCATCKPSVMDSVNRRGAPSVFVGDGLSDCQAAKKASVVFAKKNLARFCEREKIDFLAYENLSEVAARLEKSLSREPLEIAAPAKFAEPIFSN